MPRQSTRPRKQTLRAQEAEESRKAEAAGKRKRNAKKSTSERANKKAKTTTDNAEQNEAPAAALAASSDKTAEKGEANEETMPQAAAKAAISDESEEKRPQTPVTTTATADANVTPKRVMTEEEESAVSAMLTLSGGKPAEKAGDRKVTFAPEPETVGPVFLHLTEEDIQFAHQLVELAVAAVKSDWMPELEVDVGGLRANYYGNVNVGVAQ